MTRRVSINLAAIRNARCVLLDLGAATHTSKRVSLKLTSYLDSKSGLPGNVGFTHDDLLDFV